MSETLFKKGDWVYYEQDPFFKVFRTANRKYSGKLLDENGETYSESRCHRLTPLEPLENVERGTRCAVIGNHHVFSAGDIVEWDDVSLDQAPFVRNEINGRAAVQRNWIARLPDCAQKSDHVKWTVKRGYDKNGYKTQEIIRHGEPAPCSHPEWQCVRVDGSPAFPAFTMKCSSEQTKFEACGPMEPNELIKLATPDWMVMINKKTGLVEHKSTDPIEGTFTKPCPHPEWEGVWVKNGYNESYKVEWDGLIFVASRPSIKPKEWYGPDGWTQIEQAPTESIAGPKLDRPKKHGEITVPWDPYGEG